ncbi:CgeB family protein [Anaerophilus nitritogenes]|uniref:CgeB family protein n=1 Tax=Anaerophilus nitritogenes TaxID=2498136 RepID=UPI00101C095F|nr:glycosyltransferase [Anaerophilus nitritogenes]
MRIFFIEYSVVWEYLLPQAFKNLGHEVKISGIKGLQAEHHIPQMIHEFHPDLIISMGWGIYQTPQYYHWIAKHIPKTNIPHIYWSLEDPDHTDTVVLPYIRTVRPHFVFTICKERVEYFKKLGFKSAHMDYGYLPNIHYKTDPDPKYKCSIAVIANPYPSILNQYPYLYRHQSIKNLITPLIKENIRVDFWGNDWELMKNIMGIEIPKDWIHGYLHYLDANKVYSSADIILGLQNKHTQLTQRTYEILGCGGFLITSDTLVVRKIFKPGYDLIASSSPEETISYIHYYKSHPEERKKIQSQGHAIASQHSYENRVLYMLDTLKKEGIL